VCLIVLCAHGSMRRHVGVPWSQATSGGPSPAQTSFSSPSGGGPTATTAVSAYMAALKQQAAAAGGTRDGTLYSFRVPSCCLSLLQAFWRISRLASAAHCTCLALHHSASNMQLALHVSDHHWNPCSGAKREAASGAGESMHVASAPDARSAVELYVEGFKSRRALVCVFPDWLRSPCPMHLLLLFIGAHNIRFLR
jgi:hypothetical protein